MFPRKLYGYINEVTVIRTNLRGKNYNTQFVLAGNFRSYNLNRYIGILFLYKEQGESSERYTYHIWYPTTISTEFNEAYLFDLFILLGNSSKVLNVCYSNN